VDLLPEAVEGRWNTNRLSLNTTPVINLGKFGNAHTRHIGRDRKKTEEDRRETAQQGAWHFLAYLTDTYINKGR
jgi:hypothetical protein